ncbi:MAG: hypothetical protein K8F91_16835 [Candidatus Obscuribacterales bacterium]|nr:hypothetical protein [Candidatus Obscuribacterales bacterium]
MKRAISMLGALALAAGFFTLTAPAAQAGTLGTATTVHNGIHCTTWVMGPSEIYPGDDLHMRVCSEPGIGQTIDTVLADRLAKTVQQFPADVRDVLKNHGVKYYLF